MGTTVAPTYATLIKGYLEVQFYEKCRQIFASNAGKLFKFLGDCCIALDSTIVDPSELFETLNNIHKDIKFTMEQHDLQLPFLDIHKLKLRN